MNQPPGMLSTSAVPDVQAGRPRTEVSLTRVGVTGVEKVIRVEGAGDGAGAQLFFAQLQCFVDLNPRQAGAHMSRFEEVVNEAIDEVVLSEVLKAEQLAAAIAERVRDRQGGLRAEVALTARYPETVPTPVTDNSTQEIYTLYGTAVASEHGTRTLTGVEAQGMTACPCAQELVSATARERLAELGYTEAQVDEIIDAVPVATHNQRGIGTLHLGRPEGLELGYRRARSAPHRRELDVLGDLRADEALRRAARRREGARQPALRRGLRPRDGPPGRRGLPRPRARAASSSLARRTWRRSTATTSSRTAPASSPRSSASSRPASTPAIT